MPGINLLTVLIASIASIILNILWHSRLLFGAKLATLLGADKNNADSSIKENFVLYFFTFVAEFVIAYVLAYLIALTGSYSLITLLELVFWVWLGFAAAVLFGLTFRGERPWSAYFIDISYRLVSWAMIGLIIIYLSKLI